MLKTIIIDDEPKAIKSLELIIAQYCPVLEIIGTADSGINGIKEIVSKKPDLVLLDIEMPHGSGFDILESIAERNFDVIFITAYNHYAVKAIKFSAFDYILKPIDIEEFVSTIQRVILERKQREGKPKNYEALLDNLKTDFPKKLAVPLTDGIEYLNIRDIIRFEADRSYASIFLVTGRKIVVSNKSLNEYEEMLSESHFFRIHRSHLINLEHVSKFIRHDGGYAIMDDKTNLPIARQRKDEFEETMELLIKKNLKR